MASTKKLLKALEDNDMATVLSELKASKMSTYDKNLEGTLARIKTQTRASQNIGTPPTDGVDYARRDAASASLRVFLETYFPAIFHMEWSPDHLRMLTKLERSIRQGELSAMAMPRGAGKTSLLLRSGLWAVVTGLRNYIAIIAATETKAQSLLKSLKTEILHNKLLRQDYGPQLHCLTGLGNRASLANGQHVDGHLTGVEWNISRLNTGFIDHPECLASNNASIVTMGITGDIRGEQVTSVDGRILRPDLVLIDDPQTKASSSSVTQVQMRHETLVGDVLGMAGPGKSIAGLAAITVISRNDLSDRLLDREESPEWQGERCKMVYRWPDREDLWDQYRSIYEEELRGERPHNESLQFVADNYDEMHEGSKVGWEARYDHDKELSALQNAYNLRIRDEGAFHSEYQNEPLSGREQLAFDIDPREVSRRTVPNLYRWEVPSDCEFITAAIDIQSEALFFMVCAWTTAGRCYIVDYGAYPDQGRMHFSKAELPRPLSKVLGVDEEAARVVGGLDACVRALMEKEYDVGDGTVRLIDKCIIDSGWNTELVRRFCRESFHKSRLHPAKGQYIGANSQKWQKMKLERREQKGMHCKLQPPANKERGRPELLIDTNFWKTWAADRLTCNQHGNRAIVLFEASAAEHRMIGEHMASETPKRCEGKNGDIVIEWEQPSAVDNEFWDVLVYNGAAASILGVQTHEVGSGSRGKSKAAIKNAAPPPRDSSATTPAPSATPRGPSTEADFSNMTARQRLEARRHKRK